MQHAADPSCHISHHIIVHFHTLSIIMSISTPSFIPSIPSIFLVHCYRTISFSFQRSAFAANPSNAALVIIFACSQPLYGGFELGRGHCGPSYWTPSDRWSMVCAKGNASVSSIFPRTRRSGSRRRKGCSTYVFTKPMVRSSLLRAEILHLRGPTQSTVRISLQVINALAASKVTQSPLFLAEVLTIHVP